MAKEIPSPLVYIRVSSQLNFPETPQEEASGSEAQPHQRSLTFTSMQTQMSRIKTQIYLRNPNPNFNFNPGLSEYEFYVCLVLLCLKKTF